LKLGIEDAVALAAAGMNKQNPDRGIETHFDAQYDRRAGAYEQTESRPRD